MNKLQDAYGRIVDDMETQIGANEHGNLNQLTDDVWLIQALVDKEIELQARKEKLLVGSVWECVATCFGRHTIWNIGEIEQIGRISETGVCLSDEDYMPKEQFLLCFKPRGGTE